MVKLHQRPSSKVNGDYRSEPKVVEREREREFNDDSTILATLLINILSTTSTIQTRDWLLGSIGLIMVPLISMKVLIFRFKKNNNNNDWFPINIRIKLQM